uniref:Putative cytochrome P450 6a14 n=1 Tax=Lygus hesperus TaxID=30085 RepID=A0A0A9XUY7_LYGHE
MLAILIAVAFATLILWLWKYMNKTYSYWEERGVPYKKPIFFFGNSWPVITRQASIVQHHLNMYKEFPDVPYYGIFDFTKPFLVIKDIDLVERVLIKDFHHFVDHGFGTIDENTPATDINLFNMNGKKWRAMRNKFSPLFTTGKLRHMVPLMKDLSDSLVNALEKTDSEVDLRDMFQRYAMDVIASCAFGMNVNAIGEEEESEFRKMGKLAFQITPKQMFRFFCHTIFPKVAKFLRIPLNNPIVTKYFSKVLKETLDHRKNSKLTRNDFVQLFVTLQQKGSIEFEGDDQEDDYLKTESPEKVDKKMESYELTDEVMIGQAFIFLVAGFEASSLAMMWLCYELALNPDIQARARKEVVRAVKNRGVLDYDTLKDMPYFNQCVLEMNRLHTFIGSLFRICTKDYTFPGTSLSIKTGQPVLIPVNGIHEDPNHYEEPEKFNPDRFAPDVTRPNCTYLPFGDGPRICIAMRFALTEVRLCVARILMDYKLSLSPKTKLPMEIDKTSFTNLPKHPVYFTLTKAAQFDVAA